MGISRELFDSLHTRLKAAGVVVYLPADWGAQVDYLTWDDPYIRDDAIAIHYMGGEQRHAFDGVTAEIAQIQSHEDFHLNGRGWRGLAYGYLIGMSGVLYVARAYNRFGAHLGDVDGDGFSNNDEVIPVGFLLGGTQLPSDAALDTFERLWLALEANQPNQETHTNLLPLYGHQEVQLDVPTACPGEPLMDYIATHRFSASVEPPRPLPGRFALRTRRLARTNRELIRRLQRRQDILRERVRTLERNVVVPETKERSPEFDFTVA